MPLCSCVVAVGNMVREVGKGLGCYLCIVLGFSILQGWLGQVCVCMLHIIWCKKSKVMSMGGIDASILSADMGVCQSTTLHIELHAFPMHLQCISNASPKLFHIL